ncbi:hypothetical protein M0802_001476 [Mischocyttarus mexicanus]|nr:hypothetical protein M0802_001476 [Mischocyttarus mexicanus]
MKSINEMKVLDAKTATSEPEVTEKGILAETEIIIKPELPLQDTPKRDIRNTPEKIKNEINVKPELPLQDTAKRDVQNIQEKIKNEINVKSELLLQDTEKKDIKGRSKSNVKSKKGSTKNKKFDYKDSTVQTNTEELIKIELEDFNVEGGPSENYWQVIAERRRIALDDTLDENKRLHDYIESLQEENRLCNEMLNETRTLVEVLQEMIEENRGDVQNLSEDSVL